MDCKVLIPVCYPPVLSYLQVYLLLVKGANEQLVVLTAETLHTHPPPPELTVLNTVLIGSALYSKRIWKNIWHTYSACDCIQQYYDLNPSVWIVIGCHHSVENASTVTYLTYLTSVRNCAQTLLKFEINPQFWQEWVFSLMSSHSASHPTVEREYDDIFQSFK